MLSGHWSGRHVYKLWRIYAHEQQPFRFPSRYRWHGPCGQHHRSVPVRRLRPHLHVQRHGQHARGHEDGLGPGGEPVPASHGSDPESRRNRQGCGEVRAGHVHGCRRGAQPGWRSSEPQRCFAHRGTARPDRGHAKRAHQRVEPAHGRGGEVPGAQGDRRLQDAADAVGGYREPYRCGAHALQRDGQDLQQCSASVPRHHHREVRGIRTDRILPVQARGGHAPDGGLRQVTLFSLGWRSDNLTQRRKPTYSQIRRGVTPPPVCFSIYTQ